MLEQVQSTLEKECWLGNDRPLLVGVSGGPDSLCLADLLARLGIKIIIAHFDHCLRPDSGADAQAVSAMAETIGAHYVSGQADVGAYAVSQQLSIEEAARELRYRFLFEQAEQLGAQAVATGHTADDQVETVLMHLLRGAGSSGLGGMSYRSLPNAWSAELPLLRPLLGTWRAEILVYLQRYGLQPVWDPTNTETRFYRNRLRHELLPHLEAFNPGVRQRLWQTADLLRAEDAALEMLVESAALACCYASGPGWVAFDAAALRRQPLAVQRRLLRRAIGALRPGLRDIDFAAVQRALVFLAAPSRSGQMDLTAGLRLELEGERLWLANQDASLPTSDWPQMPPGPELNLAIPGELTLAGGWRLNCEVLPVSAALRAQALANPDAYQAYLDLERLELPLTLRPRRPGERFRPLGLDGHSLKLSDYMTNLRLPRRARAGWPLLICWDEVAWVPGGGIGEGFALGVESRLAGHLVLTKG